MLEHLLEIILTFFYDLTASYGFSIILLSFSVTLIMLPLYWIANSIQRKESDRKAIMQPDLDQIKRVKNKQEKYYYTKEIYRKNKYNPLYSLTGIMGLVIQIPFFLAAYYLLFDYTPLNEVSFGPIKDLFKPDGLFFIGELSINVLPFLMTLVNLVAGYLYINNMKKSDLIQLYVSAFVFLILLYNLSAALVLYWTMNNIFSIGKNWLFENKVVMSVLKRAENNIIIFSVSSYQKKSNQIINNIFYKKIRRIIVMFSKVRYYLVLLVLPYFFIVCKSIDVFISSLLIILFLSFLDIIFGRKNQVWKHIYLLIFISLFFFFYTFKIQDVFQFVKDELFLDSLPIRLRYIYLIIIVLIFGVYYNCNHKKIYSIFSVLIMVFLFVSCFQYVLKNNEIPRNLELVGDDVFNQFESNYDRKKTIFLIFDAYSSPEEVSKLDPNRDTEQLVNYLESNNWIVKREFPSLEGSTYNSVHSILNYNLSDRLNPNLYFGDFNETFYYRTRGESRLISDLKSKKVNFKNYAQLKVEGINEDDPLKIHQPVNYGPFAYKFTDLKSFVPFKEYIEKSELLFKIFGKSIFSQIFTNALPFEARFPPNNKKLFNLLNKEEIEKYDFLLYHFVMPHAPFSYYDEFILDEVDNSDIQYVKFWEFTNSKIIDFLESLDYTKYRIIISTDHGYRHSSKIDRLNTFGAFYGFDKSDVEKVKYNQDIGSLINNSFK